MKASAAFEEVEPISLLVLTDLPVVSRCSAGADVLLTGRSDNGIGVMFPVPETSGADMVGQAEG
jgi:hypothetical protein